MLTPDFLRKEGALETVVEARPDVFNHNLETVPSLYLTVRPGARYFHSIRLLQRVKELDPTMFTKSGIMVGLGEERNEVLQLMDDLRTADVDFLTIGQYLQPTRKHHAVKDFVTPEAFTSYETIAYAKGFLLVSASPLTRSSHHAGEDFARLRAARAARALTAGAMPEFRTTRRVAIRPRRCSTLVADVERYPEFVPFCERLDVRGRRKEGEREVLVADMTIGYKLVRETFTSKVTLDRAGAARSAPTISTARSGRMENSWTFKPLPDGGCEISFCIDYEFRSRTLALLMGAVFDRVFRTFARRLRGARRHRSTGRGTACAPELHHEGARDTSANASATRRHAGSRPRPISPSADLLVQRWPLCAELPRDGRARPASPPCRRPARRRRSPRPRCPRANARARQPPSPARPPRSPRRALRSAPPARRACSVFASLE